MLGGSGSLLPKGEAWAAVDIVQESLVGLRLGVWVEQDGDWLRIVRGGALLQIPLTLVSGPKFARAKLSTVTQKIVTAIPKKNIA